jgi:hypothetical protein
VQRQQIGSSKVDELLSEQDGVWYPQLINPIIAWNGGSFQLDQRSTSFFNPFAVDSHESLVAMEYTPIIVGENTVTKVFVEIYATTWIYKH